MKRFVSVLAVVVVCLGVVGCVGNTDPATNITNLSAKLNAHGFTNNGPATWWWEYDTVKSDLGTANDSEVCGNPPEADKRCGPASGGTPGSQVPLGLTVTGLTPNTTYYFRACGQDQNAAQPICGSTLSFKTLAGTAYAFDRKWGTKDTTWSNYSFEFPNDIATDPAGNVYVNDSERRRIMKFNGQGGFITKFGSGGPGDGQFGSVYGLATDSAANVYVLDQHFGGTTGGSPAVSGPEVQLFRDVPHQMGRQPGLRPDCHRGRSVGQRLPDGHLLHQRHRDQVQLDGLISNELGWARENRWEHLQALRDRDRRQLQRLCR